MARSGCRRASTSSLPHAVHTKPISNTSVLGSADAIAAAPPPTVAGCGASEPRAAGGKEEEEEEEELSNPLPFTVDNKEKGRINRVVKSIFPFFSLSAPSLTLQNGG